MKRWVNEIFFLRQQFIFHKRKGEGGIPPTILKNAVYMVEEEQNIVNLCNGKFYSSCTECFDSDGICSRKLQQKHHAIFIRLKHTAVRFGADGQGKRFADSKIR